MFRKITTRWLSCLRYRVKAHRLTLETENLTDVLGGICSLRTAIRGLLGPLKPRVHPGQGLSMKGTRTRVLGERVGVVPGLEPFRLGRKKGKNAEEQSGPTDQFPLNEYVLSAGLRAGTGRQQRAYQTGPLSSGSQSSNAGAALHTYKAEC